MQPPVEFRDDYKPIPAPRDKKAPVLAPRIKITRFKKALKDVVQSYEVGIKNEMNPLGQLNKTMKWIETYLKTVLNEIKGFKLVETLKLTFKKKPKDKDTL